MGNKVSKKASIRDIKRKTRKKYSAEEKIRRAVGTWGDSIKPALMQRQS